MASYLAAGVPAQLVRVSNTTLYRVAADYLGDALYWTRIALLNGRSDPWIDGGLIELVIPIANDAAADGIFGAWVEKAVTYATTRAPSRPTQKAPITLEQLNTLLPYLPTSLPEKAGVIWNNGGVICVS